MTPEIKNLIKCARAVIEHSQSAKVTAIYPAGVDVQSFSRVRTLDLARLEGALEDIDEQGMRFIPTLDGE